jgi:hypothetical protein
LVTIDAEMAQAIGHALTALLMCAALACTLRARPIFVQQSHMLVFRHHLLMRVFAVFTAFIIPLAITILVLAIPPKDEIEHWMYARGKFPLISSCMREKDIFSYIVDFHCPDCYL